jgi:predicted house-cleaning noncanonical NTP pyrophosphatase (MazG superfamily)
MRYDKLVRDRIPEIIEARGGRAVFRIAGEEEYRERLERKLEEETAEFLKEKNAEELADILEVVYALGETLGVAKGELETLREKKAGERGGFRERIVLEEA